MLTNFGKTRAKIPGQSRSTLPGTMNLLGFRILVAIFSAVTAFITTGLFFVAYFGTKEERIAKRFLAVAVVAATILLLAIFL